MSDRIGIARLIDAEWVNPMRCTSRGADLIEKRIAVEKEWIDRSIALGFKKHHKTPAAGSKVEYNVVELRDGSIKVEGWQEIEESAQHSGDLHDETDTIPTREGREEGGEE